MTKDMDQKYGINARGELLMLRTHIETDQAHFQPWQTWGEWRSLDAPWERNKVEKTQN